MIAELALALIERFPKLASKSDSVLMAIAKTFPHGDYQQTYIYLCKLFYLKVRSIKYGRSNHVFISYIL